MATDGGWKNADRKMRMIKCEWKNADDKKKNENVGTRPRGSKLTKFPYILSCKMRPKKFTDRNIFYAGYEKSEIKKKHHKTLIKEH